MLKSTDSETNVSVEVSNSSAIGSETEDDGAELSCVGDDPGLVNVRLRSAASVVSILITFGGLEETGSMAGCAIV